MVVFFSAMRHGNALATRSVVINHKRAVVSPAALAQLATRAATKGGAVATAGHRRTVTALARHGRGHIPLGKAQHFRIPHIHDTTTLGAQHVQLAKSRAMVAPVLTYGSERRRPQDQPQQQHGQAQWQLHAWPVTPWSLRTAICRDPWVACTHTKRQVHQGSTMSTTAASTPYFFSAFAQAQAQPAPRVEAPPDVVLDSTVQSKGYRRMREEDEAAAVGLPLAAGDRVRDYPLIGRQEDVAALVALLTRFSHPAAVHPPSQAYPATAVDGVWPKSDEVRSPLATLPSVFVLFCVCVCGCCRSYSNDLLTVWEVQFKSDGCHPYHVRVAYVVHLPAHDAARRTAATGHARGANKRLPWKNHSRHR